MQKQCPGKFHGSAIKYIDESQKYCVICQQQINLQKKETKEKAKKIVGTVLKIGGKVLGICSTVVSVLAIVGGKTKDADLLSGKVPKKNS